MTETPIPPLPPTRWERIGDAADRLGLPTPDLLRSELTAAGGQIRSARIGVRGLVLVASADVDAFARRLAAGELAA